MPLTVLLVVVGFAETTLPLLVHFCTRSHAIDREVDQLARPTNLDEFVAVGKNVVENFLFGAGCRASVYRASARMNDAVHVEEEIVDRRVLGCVCVTLSFQTHLVLVMSQFII